MIRPPTIPLKRLPQPDEHGLRSTWRDARPRRIARALELSQTRDPGGWFVAGASTDVRERSIVRTIAGREVTLWRGADGRLHAGPGACPHLGALMDGCVSDGDDVLCRWHGMALPREAGRGWLEFTAHDDGVLVWVRLPAPGEEPSDAPVLPPRPPLAESIAAVIALPAACEPRDIIANRLDPGTARGSTRTRVQPPHRRRGRQLRRPARPRRRVPPQPHVGRPGACRLHHPGRPHDRHDDPRR